MPLLSRVAEQRELMRRANPPGLGAHDGNALAMMAEGPADRAAARLSSRRGLGLFSTCANTRCQSGWLRLWRSRSGPRFEEGWSCSPDCTAALVASAVRREMEGFERSEEPHAHRVPLGLIMLEQGWITQAQLRRSIEAQRAARGGRLGYWLMRREGVSEQLVTRALGLQWSCPVLAPDGRDSERLTALLPRFFVDAYGVLPWRVAAGRVLYLGFEVRPDPVLALAVERMAGLRVECGIVPESLFRPAHRRMLDAEYPRLELMEAARESALVKVLARRVEQTCPSDSRLVRVHDCLWLRMGTRLRQGPVPDAIGVRDVICSLRAHSLW